MGACSQRVSRFPYEEEEGTLLHSVRRTQRFTTTWSRRRFVTSRVIIT